MEADQREAERLLEMAEQDKDERLTALMKVSRSPSPRLRACLFLYTGGVLFHVEWCIR